MCLEKKGRFKPTKEGIGYKVIKRSWDNSTYVTICQLFPLKVKEWNTAENTSDSSMNNGFHIFDKEADALRSEWVTKRREEAILVQVQYGKEYHVGYGDGLYLHSCRTIVAKKMRILKEIPIK